MTTTVVVNCHMNRMAAKRAKGFATGYNDFFDTLEEEIRSGRALLRGWGLEYVIVESR